MPRCTLSLPSPRIYHGRKRRLRKVQCLKDISYEDRSSSQRLDIYAPLSYIAPQWIDETAPLASLEPEEIAPVTDRLPFVLYIHGGGFRTLSKETHWSFGLQLAEEGFVVFMIDYRLTPDHPCPAALEDCASALDWILNHHETLNIDLERGMIAGESAGGHLTLALTLALVRPDPAPWAEKVFRHQWVPKMIAPACAFLDIISAKRSPGEIASFYQSRLDALGRAYLKNCPRPELALPLTELEDNRDFVRPFPPTLVTVGEKDIILKDSERLADILLLRGIKHQLITYPGGIHAFHAVISHPLAKKCWRDHMVYWFECLESTQHIDIAEELNESVHT